MVTLLSAAGRSFLRAFAGALVILLPGILEAPDVNAAKGLAVAALIASIAAGLRAIQVFVPQLSFGALHGYGAIVDSFVRAFIAAFLVSVLAILNSFDLSTAKALIVAALIAAVTAGIRAVQGFLTQGDVPAPDTGLAEPPTVAS